MEQKYDDFICYPAIIEKGKEEYGVYFPDLQGCISGGKSVEEAVKNAKEALALHIFGMEEDGEVLPIPTDAFKLQCEKSSSCILIEIEYGIFREKMQKKSVDRMVTLPSWLNKKAKASGINISAVLQEALKQKLNI